MKKAKLKQIPNFKSIEEESDYWDNHEVTEDNSIDVTEKFLKRYERKPRKRLTMWMDIDIIKQLKKSAKKYNIPYQRLTHQLIELGLEKI